MSDDKERDARRAQTLAIKSGLKLFLSLIGTLMVAMGVRFYVPRVFGPEIFGQIHFAEGLALLLFLWTRFGVEGYISKEIAINKEHASDFLGGVFVLRAVAFVVGGLAVVITLVAMNKGELEWKLCLIFALWQICVITSSTFETLLTAVGEVSELAILKVASKLVWGVSIIGGLTLFDLGPVFIAIVFCATEAIKLVVVFVLARRYLAFKLRVWGETFAVLRASMPFYLNNLAHMIFSRVDVQMLTVMANDEEVGFYGASGNLAIIVLLLLPLMSSVVLPMGARLAALSFDKLNETFTKAMTLFLVVGVLIAVLLVVHAEAIVTLAFGEAFAPAVLPLQVLVPTFPLSYLAVLTAIHLMAQDKVWSVTRVSVFNLLLNPALNYFLIPLGAARFGEGGAGSGAALASVITEVCAVVLQLYALRGTGLLTQTLKDLPRLVLATAAFLAVHLSLDGLWSAPVIGGLWTCIPECAAYLGIAVALRLLRPRQLIGQFFGALRSRRG